MKEKSKKSEMQSAGRQGGELQRDAPVLQAPTDPTDPPTHFPSPYTSSPPLNRMEEIGIQLSKEDPTFAAVVNEKSKLLASLPQADEELYGKWKRLEGHEEFLDLQEVSNWLSYVPVGADPTRVRADEREGAGDGGGRKEGELVSLVDPPSSSTSFFPTPSYGALDMSRWPRQRSFTVIELRLDSSILTGGRARDLHHALLPLPLPMPLPLTAACSSPLQLVPLQLTDLSIYRSTSSTRRTTCVGSCFELRRR